MASSTLGQPSKTDHKDQSWSAIVPDLTPRTEWPIAASRCPGLLRNWTPALWFAATRRSLLYFMKDQSGRPIKPSPARAKGAIGRLDFHFALVLRAGGEPECAARGLNNGEQKEAIMPQTATRGAATLDAHTTDTSAGWERLFVGAPLGFVKLVAAIAMTGGHTNLSLFNSDYVLLWGLDRISFS